MCPRSATLFLCGDVMTGRGVDQILAHPSDPRLAEDVVHDARIYVELAEDVSGEIPRRVAPEYVWGDALDELARVGPDVRIVNLETSVTRSEELWPGKAVSYRMHPANVGCLTVAGIDVGVLANNHVLDWGTAGLAETITTLTRAGLKVVGAGRDVAEARRPATVDLPGGGRVVVVAFASATSGVPLRWAAGVDQPGVDLIPDLSDASAEAILARIHEAQRPGDHVVASIHWGSNWGYDVPAAFVHFAHRLIDGGVALVHGHSSHHPRPIEVYRDRLILYGCGDLIDDYEGITGYEEFRGDLSLMYFCRLDLDSGAMLELRMVPMRILRMRLTRPSPDEVRWLAATLGRASARHGTAIALAPDGSLVFDTGA